MAKKEKLDVSGWGNDPMPKAPSKRAPVVLEILEPMEFLPMSDDDIDPRIGQFSSELRVKFYANFDELKPIYDISLCSSSLHAKPADAVRALYLAQESTDRLLSKIGYKWVGRSTDDLERARQRKLRVKHKKLLAKTKREEAKELLAQAQAMNY